MADEKWRVRKQKTQFKGQKKFYGMISDLFTPLIRKFNNRDAVSYQKNPYSDKFFTLNLNIQQIM